MAKESTTDAAAALQSISATGRIEKMLTTEEAARALNLKPGTLRRWACMGSGPIRPIKIYGRLGWFEKDISNLLNRHDF